MTDTHRQKSLKQGVRTLFDNECLDREQLARLQAMQQSVPAEHQQDAPQRPDRRRWLGVAAAVVVSAGAGYLGARHYGVGSSDDRLQQIADEIAYNHHYDKRLDVEGHTLDALRPTFAPLGFRLSEHPELATVHGQLRGGRFCSVASVPAALLRYEAPGAARHITVYQARHDAERHAGVPDTATGDTPAERHARGTAVRLWREHGVLFAIATDVD